MSVRCALGRHRPKLDVSDAAQPEPGIFVGPIRRYCDRCGVTLPGDSPQVGDRRDVIDSFPEFLAAALRLSKEIVYAGDDVPEKVRAAAADLEPLYRRLTRW